MTQELPDLETWVLHARKLKAAGHKIYQCNNPVGLQLGYHVEATGEVFYLSVKKVRGVASEILERLEIQREDLASNAGREAAFGFDSDPFDSDPFNLSSLSRGEDLDLIWDGDEDLSRELEVQIPEGSDDPETERRYQNLLRTRD